MGLLVCSVALMVGAGKHPFKRGFIANDESISYPHEPNTFSVWTIFLIGAAAPLSMVACHLHNPAGARRPWPRATLVRVFVLFVFGVLLVNFSTDVLKLFFGRLRPDFISRCSPPWLPPAATQPMPDPANQYITVGELVCRGDSSVITEGRKSFPSGHSSSITYLMSFSIVYLERYLHDTWTVLMRTLVQLAMLLTGALVCLSRVRDHWHHPTDVLTGILLGVAGMWYIFYCSNAMPPPVTRHIEVFAHDDDVDGAQAIEDAGGAVVPTVLQ
jgi:phosphatidate phosphatase